MTTIVTRAGNGSPLTNTQMDTNLTNLNSDKLEKSSNLSDLTNAANARSNLGLGNVNNTSDATKNANTVFTGTTTIPRIASSPLIAAGGGAEGGEIRLEKAATGSTLSGSDIVIDTTANHLRVFENGGTNRGFSLDLSACAAGATSTPWLNTNDGSGSGLDADLLDGQQGSYYAPIASPNHTGYVRCDSSRTDKNWGQAQFIATTNTGSTYDFSSITFLCQDQSNALQMGFDANAGKFGQWNWSGLTPNLTWAADSPMTGMIKATAGHLTAATAETDYLTIASYPNNFSVPGYQKLPSGLVIQWGWTSITANNVALTITLPLAWPNGLLAITVSASGPISPNTVLGGVYHPTNTTTQINLYNSNVSTAVGAYWIAVGA